MGASLSYLLQTQEIHEFRKLDPEVTEFEVPEVPQNRSKTDRKWLKVLFGAVIILLPFLIYTLVYSDPRRIVYGTDNCGNLCGFVNQKIGGIDCSGKDFLKEEYCNHDAIYSSEAKLVKRECVAQCPSDSVKVGFQCYEKGSSISPRRSYRQIKNGFNGDNFQAKDDSSVIRVDPSLDYKNQKWWLILFSISITIALSIGTLYLYRYATGVVVWGILIFSTLVVVTLTIVSWYFHLNGNEQQREVALIPAIALTILSLIVLLLLVCMFKKINLVIQLYKETTKAVFAMPGIIMVPIASCWVHMIFLLLYGMTMVFMYTSGVLQEKAQGFYEYIPNGVMYFTMGLNSVIYVWISQFIVGFQYMVIAGSVAKWFFTRDKLTLRTPIVSSAKIAFNFHLGTIALGSFIITIVTIVKALLQSLAKNQRTRWLVNCCMNNIEEFIKFLSKNAYIETAIHGQSFFKSGRRAAKLLISNAYSLIALNYVGDFVMFMTRLILLIICTGISYAMFSGNAASWIPTVVMLVINFFIIAIVFSVYETTVDALFICFCEDQVLNDGMSKPYFMSRGLMEFVENSKRVYTKRD